MAMTADARHVMGSDITGLPPGHWLLGGPVELNITKASHGKWMVLTVEGEIDIATAPALDDALDEVIGSGASDIAVDLRPVSFMDSTGLRSLMIADRRVREAGGTLAVVAGTGPAHRLLELAGVTETLTLADALEDLAEA